MVAMMVAFFVIYFHGTKSDMVPSIWIPAIWLPRVTLLVLGLAFYLERHHLMEPTQTELQSFRSKLNPEIFERLLKSLKRFAEAGMPSVSTEVLATREATCRACPEWDATALNNTGRCRKCGCSTWAKLRMATERCPIGKWGAVDKTPE